MLDYFMFIFKYLKHKSNMNAPFSSPDVDDPISVNNVELFWCVTFFAILSASVPTLVKLILTMFVGQNNTKLEHKAELKKLREELRDINMMDEFAKHAKVQRKINKLTEIISAENNSKGILKVKLKVTSYIALYLFTGLIMMYITWTYKFVPLLILNTDLFYPLHNIFAFPSGVLGAIGIIPWIAIVSRMTRNFYNFFQSV